MKSFADVFPENLYHSYIVEGDPTTTLSELRTFLEGRTDVGTENPDMLCQSYDSFTINDTSQIKDWHSTRGITTRKRICIIAAKFINHEAEQSLLKMIEEPQENTHFFLLVPNASLLLPTIRSRTHTIKREEIDNASLKKFAATFIASLPTKRLEIIAEFIDDNKKMETSGNMRFEATSFVNELEKYMYENFKKDTSNTHTQFVLNELEKSRTYLSTPGASVKMILEHIALVL